VKGIIQSVRGRRIAWLAIPGLLALMAIASVGDTRPAYAQNGNLVVQKALVGADGVTPVQGDLSGFVFTVSGGGLPTPVDLPPTNAQGQTAGGFAAPANYTITEKARAGATLVGFFTANSNIPTFSFTLTAGGTTTLTARNQVAGTASVAIQKQIVDVNGAVISTVDRSGFQFTLAGANGFNQTVTTDVNGNASATNLAAGSYTIAEQSRAGFTLKAMVINGVPVSIATAVSFNIQTGQTAPTQIVVSNQQASGNSVTITKQIVDASGNAVSGDRSNFQFTVTCGTAFSQSAISDANGVATIANVPAGACNISEASRAGFTVNAVNVSPSTTNIGNNGSFTVTTGVPVSITVKNQASGSTGGATEQIQLFTGCNNVASTYASGTAASQVFANISPSSALIAGWFFINSQQRFVGYSPLPGAPNDLTSINRGDPLFICVNGNATFTRPTI